MDKTSFSFKDSSGEKDWAENIHYWKIYKEIYKFMKGTSLKLIKKIEETIQILIDNPNPYMHLWSLKSQLLSNGFERSSRAFGLIDDFAGKSLELKKNIAEQYALQQNICDEFIACTVDLLGSVLSNPNDKNHEESICEIFQLFEPVNSYPIVTDRQLSYEIEDRIFYFSAALEGETFIVANGSYFDVFISYDNWTKNSVDIESRELMKDLYVDRIQKIQNQINGRMPLCFVIKEIGPDGPYELLDDILREISSDFFVISKANAREGYANIVRKSSDNLENPLVLYDLVISQEGINAIFNSLSNWNPTGALILYDYKEVHKPPSFPVHVIFEEEELRVERLRELVKLKRTYEKNSSWLLTNYSRLSSKHPNQWIAVCEVKDISAVTLAGESEKEVEQKAKELGYSELQLVTEYMTNIDVARICHR
jgi:hypothetical protein